MSTAFVLTAGRVVGRASGTRCFCLRGARRRRGEAFRPRVASESPAEPLALEPPGSAWQLSSAFGPVLRSRCSRGPRHLMIVEI